MHRFLAALLAGAGLCAAGAADQGVAGRTAEAGLQAQPSAAFEAEEAAARAALRETPGTFAGASRASELTRTWTILSFSVDGATGETPTAWRARRIEGGTDGRTSDDWARSADCPALPTALAALEEVHAPAVDAPGVGEDWKPRSIAVAADRPRYRLWASGLRHGDVREWDELDLRGGFSSPLAEWMDATLEALAPCWTPATAPPRRESDIGPSPGTGRPG